MFEWLMKLLILRRIGEDDIVKYLLKRRLQKHGYSKKTVKAVLNMYSRPKRCYPLLERPRDGSD